PPRNGGSMGPETRIGPRGVPPALRLDPEQLRVVVVQDRGLPRTGTEAALPTRVGERRARGQQEAERRGPGPPPTAAIVAARTVADGAAHKGPGGEVEGPEEDPVAPARPLR